LQLSREELRKSSEALQEQAKTAERQRFETTFFQLLTMFNEIVKNFYFTENIRGRLFIVHLYKENFVNNPQMNASANIETINMVYEKSYNGFGYLLSGYFRSIYNILAFIDKSDFSFPEKQFYSDLLRAQLSKWELGLLFYVCLVTSGYKYENLPELVKRFNLLEYLEDSSIIPEHRELLEIIP